MTAKAKVAVTGASGLVGSHLAEHLVGKGYNVVAMSRNAPTEKCLNSIGGPGSLTLKAVDVNDKQALENAFAGCDVVVHAAGTVDPYGSRESIFKTNVEGTRSALAAARAVGVKQFIFVSSLSVITGQGDQFDVDESAELKPCGESYADSKVEAERLVMSEPPTSALKVTAVRPGFIYGPREKAWMPRLINSIGTGKAMLIGGGVKETNVIYVGNLSQAIENALLNANAFGQVFNLTDGERITKKQLFDAIADGLSLPRVTKQIPVPVARFACEMISSFAPMLPVEKQRSLARFSRAAFRLAGVNQGFSVKKAEKELNYVNRVPFKVGMDKTLEYFKAERSEKSGKEAVAR
jgi:nucleoside-diphosphate-sugar epimerase